MNHHKYIEVSHVVSNPVEWYKLQRNGEIISRYTRAGTPAHDIRVDNLSHQDIAEMDGILRDVNEAVRDVVDTQNLTKLTEKEIQAYIWSHIQRIYRMTSGKEVMPLKVNVNQPRRELWQVAVDIIKWIEKRVVKSMEAEPPEKVLEERNKSKK